MRLHGDMTEKPSQDPDVAAPADASRATEEPRRPARLRAAVAICAFAAALLLAAGMLLLLDDSQGASETPTAGGPATQRTAKVRVPKTPSPAPSAAHVVYSRPVRLVIPKIDLKAEVELVGLTAGHAMASPSGPDTVAWYKRGPRPGNEGTAVIDGHSGYAGGREAAFDELGKLGKGDRLYVQDSRGRVATFVVRTTRLYARNASAAPVFASTAKRRLNLITCAGSFDVAAGTHAQRLVVFAELKPSAAPVAVP
jgi:sortase A